MEDYGRLWMSACWVRPGAGPKMKILDLITGSVNSGVLKSVSLKSQPQSDGIYLFGTTSLPREFANSFFKSADGTFKICPKMFYQVLIFLAQVGGVYVPTMFALMPDKSEHSYGVLFGILHQAFGDLNIDTNWKDHYFMLDFE